MKSPSIILSIAVAVAVGNPAWAAPLAFVHESSGAVSVQSSKGVSPARPGVALSEGDRVITGPEGSAVVAYSAGKCAGRHQVPARSIATVSKQSCLKVAGGSSQVPVAQNAPGVPDEALIALGAAAVIGGTAAALASTGHSQTNAIAPISP